MHSVLRASVLSMVLAGALAAQSVLQPGDVLAVTTGGLWLIRPPDTTEHQLLAASSFGSLVGPSIQWRPGTDELLVCSGSKLFSVSVGSLVFGSATVTDITPAASAGAVYQDLDVHPADGRLLLLDGAHAMVLRYAPPFVAGMAPDLVLPVGGGARSLAVDSHEWPERVLVSYASTTKVHFLSGGSYEFAAVGVTGLDRDRQVNTATVGCVPKENSVLHLPGSGDLAIEVNVMEPLCAPVALRPMDVEFDTKVSRVLIFAQDGVNAACMPGHPGKNHVVSMLEAQSVDWPPIVLTGSVSTITGVGGDLALVWFDQAWASPFGSATGSMGCLLAPIQDPYLGNAGFGLAVSQAPPTAPVLLLVGFAPADVLLGGGQALLVAAPLVVFAGVTSAAGTLELQTPLDAGLPGGFDVRVQAAAFGAPLVTSNGLVLHVAGF